MITLVREKYFGGVPKYPHAVLIETAVRKEMAFPQKSPYPRLTTGLLISNARIQFKIV